MGAYKNYIMGIEELVWSALEKGMTDEENIYSYVYMHDKRVDRDTVKYLLDSMINSDYYQNAN